MIEQLPDGRIFIIRCGVFTPKQVREFARQLLLSVSGLPK